MDVVVFYNLYAAGRTTLGQVMVPLMPIAIKYVYRAFPVVLRSPSVAPIIQ